MSESPDRLQTRNPVTSLRGTCEDVLPVLSLIKENNLFIQDVKAQFDGKEVRLGKDARGLYEQSGYGRPEKDGSVLRLAPVEALYLIHRNRIEIPGL